jgi:hypothetical protein
VSPRFCVAVGDDSIYSYGDLGWWARWNGGRWSKAHFGIGGQGDFDGVSCTSTTACTTVGGIGGSGYAKRWNGTRWTAERTPKPGLTALVGVSCTSRSFCTAVGEIELDSGSWPIAEYRF